VSRRHRTHISLQKKSKIVDVDQTISCGGMLSKTMAKFPTIGIVDDDAVVRESVCVLLETQGFEVKPYPSGVDFLRDAVEVECLIVDQTMPGLDGLDFMSELRRRGSNVPTIMITGTRSPRIERLASDLGIKCVLEKPASAQVLLGAIHRALGISR
jgi:two-component system, LuxR family, response regulator FixJ